jgi:hypothetical protein
MEEVKQRMLKSDELDDVTGLEKPKPLDSEAIMEVLKGNKFKFSLDHGNFKEYLVQSRKISELILKRSVVNIERGLATIEDHLEQVNEPQYRSVFLMRFYQVAIEQLKTKEAAELTKRVYDNDMLTK